MFSTRDGHELAVHDWGNANSDNPIIFLHGGPGSGVSNKYKQSFNPEVHRVIFFDQRGAGLSQPYGSLESNDTWKLVSDISAIADHLQIDKFTVTGGSWGSCLALVYAINNPERVKAMVLTGIFTGTKQEADWIFNGRFKEFFPDVWQKFLDQTPPEHHQNPAQYHIDRIHGTNEQMTADSARIISDLELSIMSLDDRYTPFSPEGYDPTHARLETHYIANNCFLEDGYILNNASKLTMPIWLVQGRYDFVCPPSIAWNLHNALPNSKLSFTMDNHSFGRSTYDVYKTVFDNLKV